MNRRSFLGLAAILAAQRKKVEESVTASATVDATPRVAIVLSDFKGSADHDGTPIRGLADPRPVNAELTQAQIDGMLSKALELGVTRRGGLDRIVASDEWVLLLADSGIDPRVIRSLAAWLASRKAGARITVADLPAKAIVADLSKSYPEVQFDTADLAGRDCVDAPVPSGAYCVAGVVQQCDKVISIAALRKRPETGVSLSLANYLRIARLPKSGPGELGDANEVMVDLFGIRPADYAIVAGKNLIVAGAKPAAVDAVATAILGFNPAELKFLRLAEERGFGTREIDAIWTRGNEIEEARRAVAGGKSGRRD